MTVIRRTTYSSIARLMVVVIASTGGWSAGCGSDSSTRRRADNTGRQYLVAAPRPRYEHLVFPQCIDTRDESEAYACWRVSPAAGGRFVKISASCGITERGTVECWKSDLANVPAGKFSVIDDDGWNACAARSVGGIACWGDAPWPAVPPSAKFVAVAVGGGGDGETDSEGVNACGLMASGDIECWGDGSPHWNGRLFVPGPFESVDLGSGSVVAQTADGKLVWFSGSKPFDTRHGPYKTFSQNGGISCQLLASGEVECEGGIVYRPVLNASPPRDLTGVAILRTGWEHACALEDDGDVRCWGDFRPPPKLKFRYISQPDHWDSYCGITMDDRTFWALREV